ncbi:hypothetical protein K488DRAFT_68312 [Vararia minispora EC-137]|uniref:Uncharacterized protein n=1 Tax=Vararia minispora EC-137 TaxID=1314806 RepID=A0ACB8QVD3_9AGAM|nr:hypothetical protein K488DRAFT_68312 [Vararia minispora EC-137]
MSSNAIIGEPSRKRTRTSSSNAATDQQTVVIRHPVLWLDDGNIVLRTTSPATVEAPTTQTLYRIHKSILALNATFFEDMFAGGADVFDAASEQCQGFPVIDMPDPAEDVEPFLKSIFVSNWMLDILRGCNASNRAALFPAEFEPVLRLATKYGATAIRQAAVEALQAAWPSSLAVWDKQQGARRYAVNQAVVTSGSHFASPEYICMLQAAVPRYYPNPVVALRLAHDCDVPTILPVVYYALAVAHGMRVPEDLLSAARKRSADLSGLSSTEFTRLLDGLTRIQYKFMTDFRRIGFNEIHGDLVKSTCISPVQCSKSVKAWWKSQFDRSLEYSVRIAQDILYYTSRAEEDYKEWVDEDETIRGENVCSHCLRRPAPLLAQFRQEFWESLPEMFDLSVLPLSIPFVVLGKL